MDRSRTFAWLVTGATLVLFVGLALYSRAEIPPLTTFMFWTFLFAAAELLPISLGLQASHTMSFPILLAIAMVFDPLPAMCMAGLGAIDPREFKRELPLHRALFNRSQTALSVGAATTLFLGAGSPFNPGLVAGAAILRLLVNLGLVATAVKIQHKISWREAASVLVPDPFIGFAIPYVLLTGLGVSTAAVYLRLPLGEWVVVAILVPLAFARVSLQGARTQQELSERIREQQQALLEATERVFYEREQERNRIAGEIHDSSLQMLAGAAYGCGNAAEFIRTGRPDLAREALTGAREAIDEAIKGLRDSIVDLRKSMVEEGGLEETIKHFCEQVSLLWGTEVQIEGGIRVEPPAPVALAAFQILQEGLTNALKHAQSSVVVVRINEKEGLVHITVEDEGTGFDPDEEVGKDHVGMRLMKERAARVGGRVEFDTAPGRGTRLRAVLPGGVAR